MPDTIEYTIKIAFIDGPLLVIHSFFGRSEICVLLTLSLTVYLDNLFNNWRRQSVGPVIVATSLAMFARRNNELRSRVMVPADAEKYKLEEQIVFYDHY